MAQTDMQRVSQQINTFNISQMNLVSLQTSNTKQSRNHLVRAVNLNREIVVRFGSMLTMKIQNIYWRPPETKPNNTFKQIAEDSQRFFCYFFF